jgi:hypothetical protein
MTEKRIFEPIKHTFTPDEMRGLGEAIAREAQRVYDTRAEKTALTADLSAQIKAAEKKVADLAGKINNGYEIRDTECLYLMDTPRIGMKTLMQCDTSTEIRVEAMTLDEQQRSFKFTDEEPDGPDGKSKGAGE